MFFFLSYSHRVLKKFDSSSHTLLSPLYHWSAAVVSGENSNERFIPVECFRKKKVISFEVFRFSLFYRCTVPFGGRFSPVFPVKWKRLRLFILSRFLWGPVSMEKSCPQKKGSHSHPSYLGRPKFSFIFLQNLTNHLHERQKVGSVRRVTSLAGSPSFDGRVPLRAELTFLHINILARPAGSTRSKRDGKSMRGQLLIRAKGSNSFSCKRSLKLTWQGKWPSYLGRPFSL